MKPLCKRCNKREIFYQARELCVRCHSYLRHRGRIEEYPKADLSIKRLKVKHGVNIVLEFALCMSDLNHSLSKISRKYGFSRERARQIFNKLFGNKTYCITRNKLRIIAKEKERLDNFNPINKAMTANKKSFTYLGRQATAKVYAKLLSCGMDVAYPLKQSTHNLIVDDGRLKLEVRSSGRKPILPNTGSSNAGYYRVVVSHLDRRTADFIIVYVPDTQDFYIIPVTALAGLRGRVLYIRARKRKINIKRGVRYEEFKNAWELLNNYYIAYVLKE